MAVDKKKYDIIVLGATGFTGSFIFKELVNILSDVNKISHWDSLKEKHLKIAIAGRNSVKLNDLVKNTLNEYPSFNDGVDCLVVDVTDLEQLMQVTEQAKVVLSAVGPYKIYGPKVLEACINTESHYVDITGEVGFIENSYCEFNNEAKRKDLALVHCCGFDSTPADLGTLLLKKYLVGKGLEPQSIDMFVEFIVKSYSGSGNFTTFECAMLAMTQRNPYRKKFKELLPRAPAPPNNLSRSKLPAFEPRINGYVIPFPMADGPVVNMTQNIIHKEKQSENCDLESSITSLPASNIGSYFKFKNLFHTIAAVFMAIICGIILKLPFGPSLILRYPHFFTLGVFKPLDMSKPSLEGIKNDSFNVTFIAKCKKAGSDSVSEVKAKFSGPEPGYNFTSKAAAVAALTILKEKVYDGTLKVKGVLTPGLALFNTNFTDRINAHEPTVKFEIYEN